ncbi:hypothetical protein NliqN6_0978 [Naganishia liquefaciens]|uniref:Amino acid transporter transmembrane domain-containing protein n=1 Tax=Naganishia liquefaciens TaxID=104408 RepID=A0A8H3TPK3_9TREE|nr:hypothetical protein NliqN6_0978 [Naganishia liquefaciens]
MSRPAAQHPHLIDHGLPGGPTTGFDPEKATDHDRDTVIPGGGPGSYASPTLVRTRSGASAAARRSKVFGSTKVEAETSSVIVDDESSALVQIEERTLTWQQTTALLLIEYVVLAILAFPYSFQILGMAGGMITTVVVGLSVLYTSHVLWRFCLAHPEVRDIADAAYVVAGRRRIAWYAAFIGLALNNLFIMGLHVNAASTAINTVIQYEFCTVWWGVIFLVIMWAGSLIRGFKYTEVAAIVSAGTMFICYLLVVIGHGVQGTPNGYKAATATTPATSLEWTVWAPEGTTFVQGVSALLNIAYTFIGQALIPSFVGDMKRPEDFPKALYISMTVELALFSTCGAIVYSYAGTALTTAPAYGSLIAKYGKPAAALVLPTVIIVGILYSLVTSRAVFFQIFPEKSIHRQRHTVKGWAIWIAIVSIGWIIAFVIAESIPFFSDLLSLISSLFDSWFGYILWACCYWHLNRGKPLSNKRHLVEYILNIVMFITGFFLFGAGTYASVQSIINSYSTGNIKTAFSCVNSGFEFTR